MQYVLYSFLDFFGGPQTGPQNQKSEISKFMSKIYVQIYWKYSMSKFSHFGFSKFCIVFEGSRGLEKPKNFNMKNRYVGRF